MKAMIERFRNAPPLPREERERLRVSGGSVGSATATEPWWSAQSQALDQTAQSVQHELDAVERSRAVVQPGATLSRAASLRWAGVGGSRGGGGGGALYGGEP